MGHAVAVRLRHCATSRKVAGAIPVGVTGIFDWHNPSGRTMVLGSTKPLTEMSARNTSLDVKLTGAQGWQPYHLREPTVLKSGSLNHLETSGPVQTCLGISLPLLPFYNKCNFSHSRIQCYAFTAYNFILALLENPPWLERPTCRTARAPATSIVSKHHENIQRNEV